MRTTPEIPPAENDTGNPAGGDRPQWTGRGSRLRTHGANHIDARGSGRHPHLPKMPQQALGKQHLKPLLLIVSVSRCTVNSRSTLSVKKYYFPVAPCLPAIPMGLCQTLRRAGAWRMPERVLRATALARSCLSVPFPFAWFDPLAKSIAG